MRGIDGALSVLKSVSEGAFLSESLRRVQKEIPAPAERKLAAVLAYASMRRYGLWRHVLSICCRRKPEEMSRATSLLLLAGTAGVLEVKNFSVASMVSAMVQRAKTADGDDGPLVNAVLRAAATKGPAMIAELERSHSLADLALVHGVPQWAAEEWSSDHGSQTAKELIMMNDAPAYMSVRVSPGGTAPPASEKGAYAASARLEGNPFPPDVEGYKDGLVSPMSESSMWAVESMMHHLQGCGALLDMCAGRGMKAAQLLSSMPDLRAECWDVSERRLEAAKKELARLGAADRAITSACDARIAIPSSATQAILLDAPCSGSGTWRRHPEGKWRMSREKLLEASKLQSELFSHGADILAPGGVIMYCTCSLFRTENERAVGTVLSARDDLTELPLRTPPPVPLRKGRPYGGLIFPESKWADGFYMAIFRKKG